MGNLEKCLIVDLSSDVISSRENCPNSKWRSHVLCLDVWTIYYSFKWHQQRQKNVLKAPGKKPLPQLCTYTYRNISEKWKVFQAEFCSEARRTRKKREMKRKHFTTQTFWDKLVMQSCERSVFCHDELWQRFFYKFLHGFPVLNGEKKHTSKNIFSHYGE